MAIDKKFFQDCDNKELARMVQLLQHIYHAWYPDKIAQRTCDLIIEASNEVSKRVKIIKNGS